MGDVHDRVHVPGASRQREAADDTAMAVEQGRHTFVQQQQQYVPAPRPRTRTDPEAHAGMPKGQDRRRKEGGIGSAMRSSTSMLAG